MSDATDGSGEARLTRTLPQIGKTFEPSITEQQGIESEMSEKTMVGVDDDFPSDFCWDGRGYGLEDPYVGLANLLADEGWISLEDEEGESELRCDHFGYRMYTHGTEEGVDCPVDRIYKPMLDVGKYHIQRSYEHRNRSGDRALDRLEHLKEEAGDRGVNLDYLMFIDLTCQEEVSRHLLAEKDFEGDSMVSLSNQRGDLLDRFKSAVSEFYRRLYSKMFPEKERVEKGEFRCDAHGHTVEDCPDCWTEKVRCNDVGMHGHHVGDCPNCYDIKHRCECADHSVEDCPNCYEAAVELEDGRYGVLVKKRAFSPQRTVHVWSSKNPLKPHLHAHTVLPNVVVETIKERKRNPAGSGAPDVINENYIFHRIKPFIDYKILREVWQEVLEEYDLWVDSGQDPVINIESIKFRGAGRVATERAKKDNHRIHHKLSYMCRLPLEDLNENLEIESRMVEEETADGDIYTYEKIGVEDADLDFAAFLVSYTTSRSNLGFCHNLKRTGYDSNESIPVRCPICQSEMEFECTIKSHVGYLPHLVRNNEGFWEVVEPPPQIEDGEDGDISQDGSMLPDDDSGSHFCEFCMRNFGLDKEAKKKVKMNGGEFWLCKSCLEAGGFEG